ncbi:MAG: DinB family protein [Anaerolineae bacterium]|nr:DinB family protein [Anaerolineae bacterium]
MLVKIGSENGFVEKSIAWVIDHPGCFAYGKDDKEAILRVPQAMVAYQEWIGKHTEESWLSDLGDFDVRLIEALEKPKDGSPSRDWFQFDEQPLSQLEVEHGLKLLGWSRADLLDIATSFSDQELDQTFEGERWSIRGIVGHIASAETWYLDRLGLAEGLKENREKDVFSRLVEVRKRTVEVLPLWVGNAEIREVDDEKWSARKLLRRAAWHEMDHIGHIIKLMMLL